MSESLPIASEEEAWVCCGVGRSMRIVPEELCIVEGELEQCTCSVGVVLAPRWQMLALRNES